MVTNMSQADGSIPTNGLAKNTGRRRWGRQPVGLVHHSCRMGNIGLLRNIPRKWPPTFQPAATYFAARHIAQAKW